MVRAPDINAAVETALNCWGDTRYPKPSKFSIVTDHDAVFFVTKIRGPEPGLRRPRRDGPLREDVR